MFGLGFQEVLLLLLIALLLFGAKKLPDIGRALGQSIREFKKAFDGEAKEAPKEALKDPLKEPSKETKG